MTELEGYGSTEREPQFAPSLPPAEQIEVLCGATDGLGLWADEGDPERCYGRCTLPWGHGDPGPMAWHREDRDGELWAEWRGPIPDAVCRICGKKGSEH